MKQTKDERAAMCLLYALRCISEARFALVDASFYRTLNRPQKLKQAEREYAHEVRRAARWIKRADALTEKMP